MQIIWEVWISEGQIIRATLYLHAINGCWDRDPFNFNLRLILFFKQFTALPSEYKLGEDMQEMISHFLSFFFTLIVL